MQAAVAKESDEGRRKLATAEAGLWLERLERILKPDEGESFRKWLKEPLHREVILHRCKLWHGPEILAVLLELIPDIAPARSRSHSRRIILTAAFAISILGLSTYVLTGMTPHSKAQIKSLRAQQIYWTPAGVRREFELPDGSTMMLNTATQVNVSYGPHVRDVALLKGEASFKVANDPNRPFLLSVGFRQFEAMHSSSRLNLRRVTTENTELLVMEGQVRVLRSRVNPPLTLTAAQLRGQPTLGDRVFHALEGGNFEAGWNFAWKLAAGELRQKLAWQQDLIAQADARLSR